MIIYSILFNLIIFINKINGILEINYNIKNECSVRIETDNGIETCFNHQCSDYKDPWRIIDTHIQEEPCYLHYLKLSFTTYDQLLVFIELQQSNRHSIENFFADGDSKLCMLEIIIDVIYPFNKDYFLTKDMLNKLGGKKERIDILQIEIKRWYNSSRSHIQFIENDIVDKQPFQQITILYQCNIQHKNERLVLAKYLQYQERSKCPTQIQIIKNDENYIINKPNDEIFYYDNNDYIKIFNITDDSFNKSDDDYKIYKKSTKWNLFIKIGIILIIIVLIIAFIIYYFIYSSSQSNKK